MVLKSDMFHATQSSFFLVSLGGVRLSPLGTSATVGLLFQPRMIDDDDYGTVRGMRIGRGNRSTRRKSAPVSLCPPQIPHDLTWDRTRAAAVGSRRLTAWAMARPAMQSKTEIKLRERHTRSNLLDDLLVHAWKNQALTDLLHAMPKTVPARQVFWLSNTHAPS
jgi:hypothetical protein